MSFLGSVNQIAFETDEEKEWLAMDVTTEDVKENCQDLKVLGKGDFKTLMKWRTTLREEVSTMCASGSLYADLSDSLVSTSRQSLRKSSPKWSRLQRKSTRRRKSRMRYVTVCRTLRMVLTDVQLERLNAEGAARAKRERRRANEHKTRTIQRMQLQMTAPMDIGMEQHDLSLRGQDDIFDLEHTAKGLRKNGGLSALGDEDDAESSEEDMAGAEDDENEVLDSEDERERKVGELEAELEGLYDAYQERLKEQDAKYKVKEARKNNKDREEWSGIQKKDSDDEDSDEDDEEGGYDIVERAKERAGGDSDSESDSDMDDDSGFETTSRPAKRPRTDDIDIPQRKKARVNSVASSSKGKESLSRNAQVWFSQGMFKGTGLSDVEDGDEDEDKEEEDADMNVDEDSGVDVEEGPSHSVCSHAPSV